MNRKLQMIFKNANNSNITITLEDPREDLTGPEVSDAMDGIVTSNVFKSKTGVVTSASAARVITTEVTELEI